MGANFADQLLKPINAAKRLGIYLPATPPEFQAQGITRGELAALEADPPEWLVELRRNGPHPRPVVAGRLGVSISGLARAGVTEALTTAQIDALRADPQPWLVAERERAAANAEATEVSTATEAAAAADSVAATE